MNLQQELPGQVNASHAGMAERRLLVPGAHGQLDRTTIIYEVMAGRLPPE